MRVYRDEFYHSGIKGMHWGVRRYQNEDGTLTEAGKKRYGSKENYEIYRSTKKFRKNVGAKLTLNSAGLGALTGVMLAKTRIPGGKSTSGKLISAAAGGLAGAAIGGATQGIVRGIENRKLRKALASHPNAVTDARKYDALVDKYHEKVRKAEVEGNWKAYKKYYTKFSEAANKRDEVLGEFYDYTKNHKKHK